MVLISESFSFLRNILVWSEESQIVEEAPRDLEIRNFCRPWAGGGKSDEAAPFRQSIIKTKESLK